MSEVIARQVAALEQQLEGAKLLVERRNMALKLSENHEFRKLILDGFCLHDAARYAQESGDPALPADGRADALAMAQASGHLKRFLSVTVQMGAYSERTMPELMAEIEAARMGEDEEEDEGDI